MKGLKKRIIAMGVAASMLVTSFSVTGIKAEAAQSSVLIKGADYIITSRSSGKVLDVEDDSKAEGAKIIQMSADGSDMQIWTVTDGGDGYYNLVNKVSGKGIDVPNGSQKQGTELKQYNNDSGRNYQKFIITDEDGDGYYRITPKNVTNFAIRVNNDSTEDGASIIQYPYEGIDCEDWSFQLIKPDYAISDYDAVAREAYESWLAKFYYVDENGYGRLNNMNGFWTEAEVLEMFVDAYEHFGDLRYLKLAEQLYDGLMEKRAVNWDWNGYTDDTMYMTIAAVRLYLVSNNPKHLNTAKRNFELVYNRAVQENGTLIWNMDEDKQYVNACANCPTMIAAVYLGKATGDTTYYDKAATIWDWVYPNLFEEQYQKTGGYDDTGIQGIFIGSSALLYSVTNDPKYKAAALRGCEVAMSLGSGANEILNGEGVKGGDYNSVAAKGILARWLGYFTELCPEIEQFDYWMEINADSAWKNRNSDNLMWGHFGTQTIENVENDETYYESGDNVQKKKYASWACSAAVSWLINCTGRPVTGTGAQYANRIEAENATIKGGASVTDASDCSGGKYVGNIGVDNGYVRLIFHSEDEGQALLSLYYASDEARKFGVIVNGKKTHIVDCPSTGSWTQTGVPVCLPVDFEKGENKVVICGVDGAPAPNLDYVGVNLPDYVEMEDGFQEHGARDNDIASCSGGRDMEWIGGEKGGSVSFTIPAEADGKAKLTFNYATNGTRTVNIIVNGESNVIDCASTKSWEVFTTEPLSLDINLVKGYNTLVFTGEENTTAPNLDQYKLEWPYGQEEIQVEVKDTDPSEDPDEADQIVADAVIAELQGINEADITLDDEERIAGLRAVYEALTDEQKELIPAEQLQKLKDAESKMKQLKEEAERAAAEAERAAAEKAEADRVAAEAVINAINSIGTITPESEEEIKGIREAYDALTDDQKNLVTNYATLETAESEVAKQISDKAAADKAAADKAAADKAAADKAAADKAAADKAAADKAAADKAAADKAAEDKAAEDKAAEDEAARQKEETEASTVSKGEVYTYKNVKYKVTDADMSGKGTVEVAGLKKKSKTTVTIPATVKIKEATFKVTGISKNALKKCKKLKKVTIGKNVTKIGKNAFSGCSKLKTIKIQSKKLKSVGKNAFKGIHKNAKIKVPSSKLKKYKELLKKKGQGSEVTITK